MQAFLLSTFWILCGFAGIDPVDSNSNVLLPNLTLVVMATNVSLIILERLGRQQG